MANIIQAAKWMREGIKVRRPFYVKNCFLWAVNDKFGVTYHKMGSLAKFSQNDNWAEFVLGDLLANDWEIAE